MASFKLDNSCSICSSSWHSNKRQRFYYANLLFRGLGRILTIVFRQTQRLITVEQCEKDYLDLADGAGRTGDTPPSGSS